jgi:hypothetical protein
MDRSLEAFVRGHRSHLVTQPHWRRIQSAIWSAAGAVRPSAFASRDLAVRALNVLPRLVVRLRLQDGVPIACPVDNGGGGDNGVSEHGGTVGRRSFGLEVIRVGGHSGWSHRFLPAVTAFDSFSKPPLLRSSVFRLSVASAASDASDPRMRYPARHETTVRDGCRVRLPGHERHVQNPIVCSEFIYDTASFPSAHASTIVETRTGRRLVRRNGGTQSDVGICGA